MTDNPFPKLSTEFLIGLRCEMEKHKIDNQIVLKTSNIEKLPSLLGIDTVAPNETEFSHWVGIPIIESQIIPNDVIAVYDGKKLIKVLPLTKDAEKSARGFAIAYEMAKQFCTDLLNVKLYQP